MFSKSIESLISATEMGKLGKEIILLGDIWQTSWKVSSKGRKIGKEYTKQKKIMVLTKSMYVFPQPKDIILLVVTEVSDPYAY